MIQTAERQTDRQRQTDKQRERKKKKTHVNVSLDFPIVIVKKEEEERTLRSHEKTSVSSIQFKMASIRSEKHIYAPSLLSEVSPVLPLKQRHCSSDCLSLTFKEDHRALPDGVTSLAFCPQVVYQASQHIRSSETYAIRDGCFAFQSVCSVITFDSCISRAVHPQEI